MTWWMRGYRRVGGRSQRLPMAAHLSRTKAPMVPTAPTNAASSLSHSIVLEAQRNSEAQPASVVADEYRLLHTDGRVWVPDHANNIKVKLLTLTRAGQAGHRGSNVTAEILRKAYVWSVLNVNCKDFVASFLLCILSRSSSYVP